MTEPVTSSEETRSSDSPRASRLIAGVVLITVGLIFFLEKLDFGVLFRDYWPLILVGIGLVRIGDAESRGSGLWMIGVGAWLQVSELELWGLDYSTSWPLLIIFIGASMIVDGLLGGSRSARRRHGDRDAT
ncbi:MAG TPA: DUF5668 domain-containing protein [Thermoanaerobaculia bacterium]|nr:DUF5668 domain-containing protein [Thermoanaerobaculia bacterium]